MAAHRARGEVLCAVPGVLDEEAGVEHRSVRAGGAFERGGWSGRERGVGCGRVMGRGQRRAGGRKARTILAAEHPEGELARVHLRGSRGEGTAGGKSRDGEARKACSDARAGRLQRRGAMPRCRRAARRLPPRAAAVEAGAAGTGKLSVRPPTAKEDGPRPAGTERRAADLLRIQTCWHE